MTEQRQWRFAMRVRGRRAWEIPGRVSYFTLHEAEQGARELKALGYQGVAIQATCEPWHFTELSEEEEQEMRHAGFGV